MNTKYNSWKNRLTWLVVLHLDNTTKEVYEKFMDIVATSETNKQFENKCKLLLLDTQIEKEEEYDIRQVDFIEIFKSNSGTQLSN